MALASNAASSLWMANEAATMHELNAAEVEDKMFRGFPRATTYSIAVALCVCSCCLAGCVESTFTLASDSKLPKSITLPPRLTRTDVTVKLNLYTPMPGPDAKFILKNRKGKTLAEVKGKAKELIPSSSYRIVTDKGIDIIRLQPYEEHENMEQNGRAVALFYVIDDTAAGKE